MPRDRRRRAAPSKSRAQPRKPGAARATAAPGGDDIFTELIDYLLTVPISSSETDPSGSPVRLGRADRDVLLHMRKWIQYSGQFTELLDRLLAVPTSIEPCLHLADSDTDGPDMMPERCPNCLRFYVNDDNSAEPARSNPDTAPSPRLIGIVHFWILNVRITGYGARANTYIPPGTVGDLEVIETSNDARVLNARFHPGGQGNGYGLVTWPEWQLIPYGDPDWKDTSSRSCTGATKKEQSR